MRSKEEILDAAFYASDTSFDYIVQEFPEKWEVGERINAAMDAYAKEVAIAFVIFRDKFKREEIKKVKQEQDRLGGIFSWVGATDEKIYEQFLSEINETK